MTTKSKPQKRLRITSPKAIVRWAFVDRPSTKFNPEGEYLATVLITAAEAAELDARLKALAEQARADAVANAKNKKQAEDRKKYQLKYGLKEDVDDDGNPTGMFVLTCKRDAQYERKDGSIQNVTIPIYDSTPKEVTGLMIGKGSEVKVSFDVIPYCVDGSSLAGVTLRLAGMQVLKLVSPNFSSPDALGFGAEDDGFAAASEGEDEAPFEGGEKVAGNKNPGDF